MPFRSETTTHRWLPLLLTAFLSFAATGFTTVDAAGPTPTLARTTTFSASGTAGGHVVLPRATTLDTSRPGQTATLDSGAAVLVLRLADAEEEVGAVLTVHDDGFLQLTELVAHADDVDLTGTVFLQDDGVETSVDLPAGTYEVYLLAAGDSSITLQFGDDVADSATTLPLSLPVDGQTVTPTDRLDGEVDESNQRTYMGGEDISRSATSGLFLQIATLGINSPYRLHDLSACAHFGGHEPALGIGEENPFAYGPRCGVVNGTDAFQQPISGTDATVEDPTLRYVHQVTTPGERTLGLGLYVNVTSREVRAFDHQLFALGFGLD